jgi:hypothetical protein
MTKRRLFNFIISDAMADGLKAVKDRDGISESEQVRRAVANWLETKGVRQSTTKAAAKRQKGAR